MGRFFGSALITLAIVVYMARNLDTSQTLSGILRAGWVTTVIDVSLNL